MQKAALGDEATAFDNPFGVVISWWLLLKLAILALRREIPVYRISFEYVNEAVDGILPSQS